MEVSEYLDKVAYVSKNESGNDIYLSKFNNSYIALAGLEHNVRFLARREITEQLTHGVGLSSLDGKWYGWSHRAIYGFSVGSTCKKGDCHYKGSTIKEQESAAIEFWKNEYHENVICKGIEEKDGEKYFIIEWKYKDTVANKKIRNTIGGVSHHIKELGKGEWIAKTMEDAKRMAEDFSEGVS